MTREEIIQLYTAADTGLGSADRVNRETRLALWRGQSEDGRKWKSRLGKEPVPFDGATDSRVLLADLYASEDVDFLVGLCEEAQIQCLPTEAGDAGRAKRVTMFLRWQAQQMDELDAEQELAAQYYTTYGKAVLGVFWRRETACEGRELTLADVAKAAEQLPPEEPGAALPQLILDEAAEEAAAQLLAGYLAEDGLEPGAARKLVRDLRKSGKGIYERETVTRSTPEIVAMRWGDDFLAPPGTTDLQRADVLFMREWFTREELLRVGRDNKWSGEWLAEVEKLAVGMGTAIALDSRGQRLEDSETGKIRVVTAFYREPGKNGAPELRMKVWAPALAGTNNQDAYDEAVGYAHGKMPFIELPRERLSRRIEDARGYGEILQTPQQQIKQEWDLRTDRNYLTTVPPIMHPLGRPPTKWGPGVKIPRVRQDDYQYADTPQYNVDSSRMAAEVMEFADRYFGRSREPGDSGPMFRKKAMARRWLRGWGKAYKMAFQLCQQYVSEPQWVRVIGTEKAEPLQVSPEDIRGGWDVQLYYDVTNFDAELVKEKIGLMTQIVSLDAAGITDRAAFLRVAMNYLDPKLGELVLRPEDAVTQAEIEDEQAAWAKLFAGTDVDVKPGQNYGLRMKVLEQIVQGSPAAQGRMAQDKEFAGRVEKRMKQLQFQVQQQQNAVIGRLGA